MGSLPGHRNAPGPVNTCLRIGWLALSATTTARKSAPVTIMIGGALNSSARKPYPRLAKAITPPAWSMYRLEMRALRASGTIICT